MPEIQIQVNGRSYRVACGPGEEERLQTLAGELDRRISGLVKSFGQVGESQLLVVAGLLLADELDDLRGQAGQPTVDGDREARDAAAADSLERIAERIESIADRLERA